MAVYALVEAGMIVNTIAWDGISPYNPGAGITMELLSSLPAGCGIGWMLSGDTWSPPAPVVVPVVIDNSAAIAGSYMVEQQSAANALAQKGQVWEAVQLTLKAHGVIS